jgi:uncharacterized damage-inducible protein DinB
MVRIESFLNNWRAAREDAAQAVLDMPADKLNFTPQSDLMSFRANAEHIIIVGQGIPAMLLAGETDFSAPDFREKLGKLVSPVPKNATAADLAGLMRSRLEETAALLVAQPAEFHASLMKKWDGVEMTRLEMLQFVKEHEIAHRMQLFIYLRMNGVVPPTTRRKMAAK